MTVSPADFEFYRALLLEKSGLALTEEKAYLLLSRLAPLFAGAECADLSAFTAHLKNTGDKALVQAVVEAMTTNETSFFRDTKPFRILSDILPALAERRAAAKTLRVWSAACSSGQEAYSIAMTLHDFFENRPGWRYEIVGTDISYDILDQATKGAYNQFEIQRGLTIQMMVKHFSQDGSVWRVKDHLRRSVRFQYANLLEPLGGLGVFDIVFCRNVLIYFNAATKEKVLNALGLRLASDGYLFLGSCESIMTLKTPFAAEAGQHGLYRPAGS